MGQEAAPARGAPPDGTGCGPDGEPGGGRGAEGFILLTVADDGCGMPPERLQALRSSLENPGESTGIGLSNIVNRLRLFYGKDYVICVDSAEGEGTVIRIRMPDHIPGENQAEGEKLL